MNVLDCSCECEGMFMRVGRFYAELTMLENLTRAMTGSEMNYREIADKILATITPWHILDGMRVFTGDQVRDAITDALRIAEAEGEKTLAKIGTENVGLLDDVSRLKAKVEKLKKALRKTLALGTGGTVNYVGDIRGIATAALSEERPKPKPTLQELREAADWTAKQVNSAMAAARAMAYVDWIGTSDIEAFESDETLPMSRDRRTFLATFYGCEKTDITSPAAK